MTAYHPSLGGRHWMRSALATLLLAFAAFTIAPFLTANFAHAAPAPANAVIGNQASATYVDSVGVTRPVTSNTVQTTVQQVKSFTLTQTGAKTVSPGQSVSYPHTITNTGNGTDVYTFNPATTGGVFVHTGLSYFADANQDGFADSATPITAPISLPAGSSFNFVVVGTTPPTATSGQAGTIIVSVSDTNTPAPTTLTQADTTTIGLAALNVTKKLSSVPPPGYIPVAGGLSPNNGPLYVVLEYTNSGVVAADNVRLLDTMPSAWLYVPGSGRWTVTGNANALTDAPAGDPVGITYQAPVSAATGTIDATITSVPAAATGSVYFQVTIVGGLTATNPANAASTTNTASVQYSFTSGGTTVTVPAAPTNSVQYVVVQTAVFSVNGSRTTAGIADSEPITVASAGIGQAVAFTDYVWNRGSAADSFDLTLLEGTAPLLANGSTCNPANFAVANACTFPAGTTFQLFAPNGTTALQDSNGNGLPDTGSIPIPVGGACPAPYIISADGLACGYPVVIRATLPVNSATGNNAGNGYRVTLEGRSRFDTTKTDTAPNVLTTIAPNTVDLTNNGPVGSPAVLGAGADNAVVQVTNSVTPSPTLTTTTVFTLYANNTGLTPASYNLSSSFASVPGGVGLTTPPAGWTVVFRDSGNGANCTAPLGAVVTTTGATPIAVGASRLVCAEVTLPATTPVAPGTTNPSPPGAYILQFGVTNQATPSITDTILDQITVAGVAAPGLTKAFGVPSLTVGASTPLTFTIANTAGNPARTGIAFTDTLPSGIQLVSAPNAVFSAGCTGSVTFTQPNVIVVSGVSMIAGTASCAVAVNSVTGVAGQSNASCAANPAAFTNGPASISGVANLTSAVTNQCLVFAAPPPPAPNRDLFVNKSLSATQGNAPSGPYRVTLQFNNSGAAGSEKTNVTIGDKLPTGMNYVPGSLRVASGGVTTAGLLGASGTFSAGGLSGTYIDSATEVSVNIQNLASGAAGSITFDVTIAQGVAPATALVNIAESAYTANGVRTDPRPSNGVEFRVLQTESVSLRGVVIPVADAGSTVTFNNVLTNNTSRTDAFDITLTAGSFPPGTVIQLFKPDGVTLLADTNGNSVPDTGPVAPGATYQIVVRAILPIGVAGGPFQVTKNAVSVSNPIIRASANDVLTLAREICLVVLDPDNTGRTVQGGSIVYPHVLSNLGTCLETITFPSNFLTNTTAGWSSEIVIDAPVAGGQSFVGVIDTADKVVTTATTFTLPPGARTNFLNRVTAPAGASAKALGDSNVTDFRLVASRTGPLSDRDTTTIGSTTVVDNIIQGYIDSGFQRPTVFGYIGRDLFLRASAQACNQVPDVIERRTVIITGPNGEREEIIAVETGPNTGIFEATGLAVRPPPVVASNNRLEGNPLDSYTVEIIGCGRRITTTVTLIDPNGVVFDSRTNEPVAGAIVRIVTASGGVCTNTAATVSQLRSGAIVPSPNTLTTGADGRFDFPLVAAGDYCLLVTTPNGYTFTSTVPFTQLPGGRNILATGPTAGGSYGGAFRVGPETGPVIVDIPVDAAPLSGLFIQKAVSRSTVEIGDLTDYTVTINNNTGIALAQADVLLADSLPLGFTYVTGSARLDGKPLADPQGGVGPRLVFNVGRMTLGQKLKLTYRVRVGPGAAQGDGTNRVIATYKIGNSTRFSESNVAVAKVTIVGGVFSDKAYVIGKIFIDCDANRVQSSSAEADRAKTEREVGIPGVRLYMEDGTNVTSDAEGKYSFYGLSARTHVLKVDRTSLPFGIDVKDFIELSNRNLGKPDSRFIDVKNGELHKANFAIQSCSVPVLKEVEMRRRAAASLATEFDGRLQQTLIADPNSRPATDVKALPASGVVGLTAPTSTGPTADTASILPYGAAQQRQAAEQLGTIGFAPIAPQQQGAARAITERVAQTAKADLDALLPSLDNKLGFIGLKDGDTLAYAQSTIQVKGIAGANFALSVNGKQVADSRVGKKSVVADKQLQAWEFVGVDLASGVNTLTLKQVDQFGNLRGETSITVTAPGSALKLLIEFPAAQAGGATADGKTPATVNVRVVDANGVAVTSRTAITLASTAGRWQVEDLNATEPGIQTFIEGGLGEFTLLPPSEPVQAIITVTAGQMKSEGRLDFLPEVRALLATGLIEGVLNLRKLDARALTPTRAQDGFEQEITHIARNWNDGKTQAGARAAMFIKGKIKGEYLLTLAYDSDKNTRDRLFRDIQPDEFYPVYGDSSARGFDAQSTGRFYVRVDNKKSYLLYGDYNTSTFSEARKLANYNRSLTGAKQHFENGSVSANFFASRDTTRQLQEEFRANGTSGPFTLANAKGLINSEKVEIITRDRQQTGVIIRTVPLSRFADYELEPLTGRILLKAPVPTLDELFNPNSIRVTFEIDQGGKEFWVTGADAQIKLGDRFEVGGIVVEDRNPVDKFRMIGINAIAKLAESTFIIAEIAQTTRDRVGATLDKAGLPEGEKRGNASRIEFIRRDDIMDARIYAGKADAKFDNISSGLSSGRTEVGGNISYKIDDKTRLKAEALRSEDTLTHGRRDGLLGAVERTLDSGLRVELGVRHARETAAPATTASGPLPTEVTSIRARVTGDIPGVKNAAGYVELEVDPKDTDRKIAAVGGEYKLPNGGRIYGRHEFISSLTGPYGLNTVQRQNSSVIGISADYMKDGNVFSEYRIRDAISGGDAEAALGLRNLWTLSEGLKLQTGLERVHAFSGTGAGEATALTFGLEYTANPLWKGSTRLELRDAKTSESLLSTVAVASKLNQNFTFLGRNTYSIIKNKGGQTGQNEQDRLQAGVAYRDTESDVFNGLARVEHRLENDTTQPDVVLKRTVELFSVHGNWQPVRPFIFSARYATKWVNEQSNGIKAKNSAQLLSGRAIWELGPRWDVSLHGSTLLGKGAAAKTYATGVELGFMVMENLWLSAGYNFFGYRDDDFANGDYTNKGAYLRMRYKFDEDLFGKSRGNAPLQQPREAAPTKAAIAPAPVPAPTPAPAAVPVVAAPVVEPPRIVAPAPVVAAPAAVVKSAPAPEDLSANCRLPATAKKSVKKAPATEVKPDATKPVVKKPRKAKATIICDAGNAVMGDASATGDDELGDDPDTDLEEADDEPANAPRAASAK